jgi:hypothetical protein
VLFLLSYRFDSSVVLKVFPLEIIYIILDYLYSPIIEFEYSENTVLECVKYHNGRKFPYSFQTNQNEAGDVFLKCEYFLTFLGWGRTHKIRYLFI